ncbi:MAG: Uma2 family endonuclease [Chloroflexaceae bacterium]|nr:Uma2 family endonuclease [Chloroflexaceae bacterium]
MTTISQPPTVQTIHYPESDGQPMAENTEQFRWIVMIKENLEACFQDRPDVFVAGDLLWYPVEGHPEIRRAPDTMVVFGRPKGRRGSYLQWQEDGITPQVVFEVLSPGNTLTEMLEKLEFYERYGVEEYYIYNPDAPDLAGMLREGDKLRVHSPMDGWTSPRLGIRFDMSGEELRILAPDGQSFVSFSALKQQRDEERTARQQAEQRAECLAARLRELGIEPDAAAE